VVPVVLALQLHQWLVRRATLEVEVGAGGGVRQGGRLDLEQRVRRLPGGARGADHALYVDTEQLQYAGEPARAFALVGRVDLEALNVGREPPPARRCPRHPGPPRAEVTPGEAAQAIVREELAYARQPRVRRAHCRVREEGAVAAFDDELHDIGGADNAFLFAAVAGREDAHALEVNRATQRLVHDNGGRVSDFRAAFRLLKRVRLDDVDSDSRQDLRVRPHAQVVHDAQRDLAGDNVHVSQRDFQQALRHRAERRLGQVLPSAVAAQLGSAGQQRHTVHLHRAALLEKPRPRHGEAQRADGDARHLERRVEERKESARQLDVPYQCSA
jgi:hypothetical protein